MNLDHPHDEHGRCQLPADQVALFDQTTADYAAGLDKLIDGVRLSEAKGVPTGPAAVLALAGLLMLTVDPKTVVGLLATAVHRLAHGEGPDLPPLTTTQGVAP